MVKYLLFLLLAVVGILYGNLDAYSLSLNTDRCEFYFTAGSTDDSDATDLLKIVKSGGAVKICTNDKESKGYYVLSPIYKMNEVHYFDLRRVFKAPVSDGYRWEYNPPKDSLQLALHEVYMQIVENSDLRQDDDGFVSVGGMSPNLFSLLSRAWKNIQSSEEHFNNACCSFSIQYVFSYSSITELRRDLYRRNPEYVPRLTSVDFIEGGDSRAPHYTFSVENRSRMWRIDFNFDFDRKAINFERIDGLILRPE